ncbi:hypothetical protein [Paenibacillus donghaensis]|uniref:Uncharacterized protein n=1 Tax=Paenibacillus donghaensis TaxID=414771 RepID=A0A2Z2KS50_9BACL|nr:hypothetical protein [Paenibacillus donghaensis]ASA21918.1 hypothetical protein B9T62_14715 [Paenibacillus donghaensis]
MIWNGFDMSKSHMVNDTLRHCRSAADALIAQSASEGRESGDGAVHVAARKADPRQKCSDSLVVYMTANVLVAYMAADLLLLCIIGPLSI